MSPLAVDGNPVVRPTINLVLFATIAVALEGCASGAPTSAPSEPTPSEPTPSEPTPSEPTPGEPPLPPAARTPVSGSLVGLLPQGSKTVLVINRGAKVGVEVGDVARLAGVAAPCPIVEVYEYRSKCIMEADDKTIGANRAVTIRPPQPPPPPPPPPRVVSVSSFEVVPDPFGVSLHFELGYVDGVRPDDEAIIDGRPCHVWQVLEETAWCGIDGQPGIEATLWAVPPRADATLEVKPSAREGYRLAPELHFLLAAPPRLPAPEIPAGTRSNAPKLTIVYARGHGLRMSHDCLGFTDDGRAVYVVRPDRPEYDTGGHKIEQGLLVQRFDLGSGRSDRARPVLARPVAPSLVAQFAPTEARPAQAAVDALRTKERLLGCHAATWSSDGPDWRVADSLVADHGEGRHVMMWSNEGELRTALDGHRFRSVANLQLEPTQDDERPYESLSRVHYLPGSLLHLVEIGPSPRWLVVALKARRR